MHFLFLSISRSSSVCFTLLTYLMNFLQSKYMSIRSLMSQEVFENSETQWCYKDHDVICTLVRHRRTQTQNTCSMMYLFLSSRYQISHRCFISWRNSERFRSHVLQFDLTSYLKSIDHRISIGSFLHSSHRCMILSRWRSLLENFRQRIAERVTSLKKLHRWKSHIAERVTSLRQLHRWESLYESFRLSSLEYWAEDTSDCCEKVLKVQSSRVLDRCCNQSSVVWIDQLRLTSWHSHISCVSTACMLQE